MVLQELGHLPAGLLCRWAPLDRVPLLTGSQARLASAQPNELWAVVVYPACSIACVSREGRCIWGGGRRQGQVGGVTGGHVTTEVQHVIE